jgi:hypothetical protein
MLTALLLGGAPAFAEEPAATGASTADEAKTSSGSGITFETFKMQHGISAHQASDDKAAEKAAASSGPGSLPTLEMQHGLSGSGETFKLPSGLSTSGAAAKNATATAPQASSAAGASAAAPKPAAAKAGTLVSGAKPASVTPAAPAVSVPSPAPASASSEPEDLTVEQIWGTSGNP